MPAMDGAALFKQTDGPHRPPVVIMSAHGAERVSELGPETFTPKPYNPLDLMETVKKLADQAK